MKQNIELDYNQLTSIFINLFICIARWELIKLNKLEETEKNISLLKSASLLLDNNFERESRILARSIIERVVYTIYLENNNYYEDFSDWSFINDFCFKQKRCADENLNKQQKERFKLSAQDNNRINRLKKKYNENSIKKLLKKCNGNFPLTNIETHLKDLNLDVLYKYGYDLYSKEVHVMHSDGKEELIKFTKGFSENQSKILMENKKIMLTNLLVVSSYNAINILIFAKIETKAIDLLNKFSNAVTDHNELISFKKEYEEYESELTDIQSGLL